MLAADTSYIYSSNAESVQSMRMTFGEEAGESENEEGDDGCEQKKNLEDGDETTL